jgi:hypothetical protein
MCSAEVLCVTKSIDFSVSLLRCSDSCLPSETYDAKSFEGISDKIIS